MPRQVRIEFAGALYHVMCRGDRREAIFEDDRDRERLLATLRQAAARTGWKVHAYVLMTNHYHLLIETPEPNLVRGMTWFQTTCTVRYNARHRTGGHLFGGRYKAILIDPEEPEYFAALLDYIHLNPVRAGLASPGGERGLLAYPWSSLGGYVWRRGRPDWLEVERGLSTFQFEDRSCDRRAFLRRLEKRAAQEDGEKCGCPEVEGQSLQSTLRRGWYFGTEAFREWLLERAGGRIAQRRKSGQNFHGPEMREHGEAEAKRLIQARLEELGLRAETLHGLRRSDPRKVDIAREVRKRTSVGLRWIADQLRMGTAMNVSRLTSDAR